MDRILVCVGAVKYSDMVDVFTAAFTSYDYNVV